MTKNTALNFPYSQSHNEYGIVGEDNVWIGVIYQVHDEYCLDTSDFISTWLGVEELEEILSKIRELNATVS